MGKTILVSLGIGMKEFDLILSKEEYYEIIRKEFKDIIIFRI